MSATNNCTFLGNASADATPVKQVNGKDVASFRIAVNKGKDKDPLWVNVDVWGKASERAATVKKGDSVIVVGRIDLETYTTKQGQPGASLKLAADSFAFASRKEAPAAAGNQAGEDDDSPY